MSMKAIRNAYGVPAKRGGKVDFQGRIGVITGSRDMRLLVRFDHLAKPLPLHPTWSVVYLP